MGYNCTADLKFPSGNQLLPYWHCVHLRRYEKESNYLLGHNCFKSRDSEVKVPLDPWVAVEFYQVIIESIRSIDLDAFEADKYDIINNEEDDFVDYS